MIKKIDRVIKVGDTVEKINTQMPQGFDIIQVLEGYFANVEHRNECASSFKCIFEDDQTGPVESDGVSTAAKLKNTKTALSKIQAAMVHLISGLDGYRGTTIRYSGEIGGLIISIPRNSSTEKDFFPTRKLTPLKK